jgi:RNA polymerase sigma factor for flagellar operon FliA
MQTAIATLLPELNPTPEAELALLKHLPMVRFMARKIQRRLPQNVDFDDLYSAGVIGLMEATAKFDPAKKVSFLSFAQFRIRGAILDSLRILDWAPRELRHKGRQIQEVIRTLTARLGHAPAEDEIACELKTSLLSYQQLLGNLKNAEVGTLQRKRDDDSDEELIPIPTRPEDDPLFRCMQGEMKERLAGAIEDLSERERMVVTLYYYEEMTMADIGLAVGINRTRVAQIHAKAVLHIRFALSDLAPRASKSRLRLLHGGGKMPLRVQLQNFAA